MGHWKVNVTQTQIPQRQNKRYSSNKDERRSSPISMTGPLPPSHREGDDEKRTLIFLVISLIAKSGPIKLE